MWRRLPGPVAGSVGVGYRFSRRWLLVAAGGAGLVGLGVAGDLLPVPAGDGDADALRARILAAPPRPYVGYAESSGRVGLPPLPRLERTVELFTGTTRIRAFVAGPERWRVDELTPAGERGTYRIGGREYLWDFGAGQLTEVVGAADVPLRPPRAADLLPPELGRRLLGLAPADPVRALPPRRIAGRTAQGLRLTPADAETTIGRVDVWADPGSALPLRVEVAARVDPAVDVPLLATELRELALRTPAPPELVPPSPPGTATVQVAAADIGGALQNLHAPPPPDRLAGRARVLGGGAGLDAVGLYGNGLAGFALIPISHRLAHRAVDGAMAAGGTEIESPAGRAVRLPASLLSVLVRVARGGDALLVGTVAPVVLERALADLPVRAV